MVNGSISSRIVTAVLLSF